MTADFMQSYISLTLAYVQTLLYRRKMEFTNKKMNISIINTASEDFEELHKELQEKGFHLMFYTDSNKLFEELKNSFFDVILINVKIETNVAVFHDKLQKDKPNVGAIYILNDDKNLESLKQKGCFYITKPFEIEKIVNLINQILGK